MNDTAKIKVKNLFLDFAYKGASSLEFLKQKIIIKLTNNSITLSFNCGFENTKLNLLINTGTNGVFIPSIDLDEI